VETPVRAIALLATVCLALAACGGEGSTIEPPDPPVGEPLLPDIVPAPPTDVRMARQNGRWLISFSSILVNIGEGDFILRATRNAGVWQVEQDIPYSTSGARSVAVPAQLTWGGDGHGHWHIDRVAVNRLVPLDDSGRPEPGEGLADSKVGFCFYDFSLQLEHGPPEAVYSREACGNSMDTNAIGMGLSRGWGDTYNFGLPGQSIDVTELPDGMYRLWAEADAKSWFRESRSDNNTTWVDIELSTSPRGLRTTRIAQIGPLIRPDS